MSDAGIRASRHVEVQEVAEDIWRVCDRRLRSTDGGYVIAVVEALGSALEVTWLEDGRRELHGSWQEALAALDDAVTMTASGGHLRPVPIPHFPPPVRR